jgi:hypothetical protein
MLLEVCKYAEEQGDSLVVTDARELLAQVTPPTS